MSNTTVFYPLITALVKAEEIIGSERTWQAVNQTQEQFLTECFEPCRAESRSIKEIKSIASFDAGEINRFLSQRGFTIQLKPFAQHAQRREFGLASVLDLLVTWLQPGQATTLTLDGGQSYPAVRQGKKVSSFFKAQGHPSPIVQLLTTSNDEVYLTRLDNAPQNFELLNYTLQLAQQLQPIYDYHGVVFPMIDLRQKVDVSWLIDLASTDASGRPVKIAQALQETRLALNEQGARAQSAFAASVAVASAMIPKPDLIIDGPFLLWFQRPGLTQPLFIGHLTPEDWKKPGEL